jgi:hypothetical protein
MFITFTISIYLSLYSHGPWLLFQLLDLTQSVVLTKYITIFEFLMITFAVLIKFR